MGMAASQARLLSITSRLSDNELRSQLINNAKMRLTTESSQISDEYIQALNESQYMFTNYDENNKASYQKLTFNSLTAYNEFNNQYGISNASGQILVSEKDGKRFEQSAGDLETFLKAYGLENRTTYFEKLEQHENGGVIQLDTVKNPDGTTTTNFSPFSAEEIKAMYEGNQEDGGIHASYENSLLTKDFNDYIKLADVYNDKKTAYENIIKKVMQEYANGVSGNGITFQQIKDFLAGGNTNDSIKYFEAFGAVIDQIHNDGKFSTERNFNGTTFYNYMKDLIKDATYDNNHTQKTFKTTGEYSTDENGNSVMSIICDNDAMIKIIKDKTSGAYTAEVWNDVGGGEYEQMDAAGYSGSFNGMSYVMNFKDENGNVTNSYTFSNLAKWNGTPTGTKELTYKETLYGDYQKEVYFENLNILVNYFNDSMLKAFDRSKFDEVAKNSPQYSGTYNEYVAASQALSNFIFGRDVGFDNYETLDDYKWVSQQGGTTAQYNPVMDVLALEDVMNVYGEPKYAYIKDGDLNCNADAEAEWYTNLFNRMKEGYKVLENGLAVSPDWMRYALESGLVKMEQVDKEQNWSSITYTSCSDITEQTNDLAVTVAEAKYQKAMNKIENKDKAYDTELKNIDTEHTALQTEYDSIKSALDKNVERNFKLYS